MKKKSVLKFLLSNCFFAYLAASSENSPSKYSHNPYRQAQPSLQGEAPPQLRRNQTSERPYQSPPVIDAIHGYVPLPFFYQQLSQIEQNILRLENHISSDQALTQTTEEKEKQDLILQIKQTLDHAQTEFDQISDGKNVLEALALEKIMDQQRQLDEHYTRCNNRIENILSLLRTPLQQTENDNAYGEGLVVINESTNFTKRVRQTEEALTKFKKLIDSSRPQQIKHSKTLLTMQTALNRHCEELKKIEQILSPKEEIDINDRLDAIDIDMASVQEFQKLKDQLSAQYQKIAQQIRDKKRKDEEDEELILHQQKLRKPVETSPLQKKTKESKEKKHLDAYESMVSKVLKLAESAHFQPVSEKDSNDNEDIGYRIFELNMDRSYFDALLESLIKHDSFCIDNAINFVEECLSSNDLNTFFINILKEYKEQDFISLLNHFLKKIQEYKEQEIPAERTSSDLVILLQKTMGYIVHLIFYGKSLNVLDTLHDQFISKDYIDSVGTIVLKVLEKKIDTIKTNEEKKDFFLSLFKNSSFLMNKLFATDTFYQIDSLQSFLKTVEDHGNVYIKKEQEKKDFEKKYHGLIYNLKMKIMYLHLANENIEDRYRSQLDMIRDFRTDLSLYNFSLSIIVYYSNHDIDIALCDEIFLDFIVSSVAKMGEDPLSFFAKPFLRKKESPKNLKKMLTLFEKYGYGKNVLRPLIMKTKNKEAIEQFNAL